MNKKKLIILVSVLVLIGGIALSFAYFNINGRQDVSNTFRSRCLNVTIESESESISLNNNYPISDVEGLSSKPYTFTIRNTCNQDTNYEINLESLNETSNTLSEEYIKVSLSSDTMDNIISKLSSNKETETLINGAYKSHNLYSGNIKAGESKTFNFREWMDYDTTKEQGANKTYTSKINVIARPDINVNELNIKYELNNNTLTGNLSSNVNEVKYCVSEKNICEPNTSVAIEDNKITIELENKNQIVCSKLNNEKTICSNKLELKLMTIPDILAKYTKNTSRSGSVTANFTGSTPTTVYSAADDNGTSYMFAGVNPNNWVRLGNLYFRIIRFNGDGTMRLIYSGEGSAETSGTGTQIGTKAFNTNYNDNMYVGLQYTSGQVHGTGTNSTILGTSTSTDLTTLYGWYNNKVKPSYASLIDSNAGFCSDRDNYTNNTGTTSGGGTGTTTTYYGGYIRYVKGGSYQTTYIPTLRCKNASDNLKLPVGLITADEYMLAGGGALVSGYYNTTFWLHTGQTYWTMSPSLAISAYVFYVYSSGYLLNSSVNYASGGVRPVINLKSSITFEAGGNGTSSNPYVVSVK